MAAIGGAAVGALAGSSQKVNAPMWGATRLLRNAIDDDRYPLSPRVQTLKAILAKIRPEPAREPHHRRNGPWNRHQKADSGGVVR